jgi:glycosyltransferase involved in cell wall biosynthesis
MMLPDGRVTAVPSMLRAMSDIVADSQPDVVVTSSPPPSIHLVGLWLKKFLGIPWVADFRDIWSPQSETKHATNLHRKLQERLKRSYVRLADATVVVSQGHFDLLTEQSCILGPRLRLIPNGFEETCFGGEPRRSASDTPFRIGYCGTLNHLTYVPSLFEQLVSLSRERRLTVEVAGHVSETVRSDLQRIDPREAVVRLLGYMEHSEAVRFIQRCDANLITLAPAMHLDHTIPGKAYELLRAESPVIAAVPPNGSAWQLLSRFADVLLIDPTDISDSGEKLENLISRDRGKTTKRIGIDQYSWENLARRYDSVLREVACCRKSL